MDVSNNLMGDIKPVPSVCQRFDPREQEATGGSKESDSLADLRRTIQTIEMEKQSLSEWNERLQTEVRELEEKNRETSTSFNDSETRVQFLMDRVVSLLSTGENKQQSTVEKMLEHAKEHTVMLDNLQESLQMMRGQNKELAQRLSEEQCLSARLHEQLCEAQNLFFSKVAGATAKPAAPRPSMIAVEVHPREDRPVFPVSPREKKWPAGHSELSSISEVPTPVNERISSPLKEKRDILDEQNSSNTGTRGAPFCMELSRLQAVLERNVPGAKTAGAPTWPSAIETYASIDVDSTPPLDPTSAQLRSAVERMKQKFNASESSTSVIHVPKQHGIGAPDYASKPNTLYAKQEGSVPDSTARFDRSNEKPHTAAKNESAQPLPRAPDASNHTQVESAKQTFGVAGPRGLSFKTWTQYEPTRVLDTNAPLDSTEQPSSCASDSTANPKFECVKQHITRTTDGTVPHIDSAAHRTRFAEMNSVPLPGAQQQELRVAEANIQEKVSSEHQALSASLCTNSSVDSARQSTHGPESAPHTGSTVQAERSGLASNSLIKWAPEQHINGIPDANSQGTEPVEQSRYAWITARNSKVESTKQHMHAVDSTNSKVDSAAHHVRAVDSATNSTVDSAKQAVGLPTSNYTQGPHIGYVKKPSDGRAPESSTQVNYMSQQTLRAQHAHKNPQALFSDPSTNPQIERMKQMLHSFEPNQPLTSPRLPRRCDNIGLVQQADRIQQRISISTVNSSVSQPASGPSSPRLQEPQRIQMPLSQPALQGTSAQFGLSPRSVAPWPMAFQASNRDWSPQPFQFKNTWQSSTSSSQRRYESPKSDVAATRAPPQPQSIIEARKVTPPLANCRSLLSSNSIMGGTTLRPAILQAPRTSSLSPIRLSNSASPLRLGNLLPRP